MDWSEGWRSAFWIELRVAAISLASRGWPVLPGTYPANSQWAGRSGNDAHGPIPVHREWREQLGADPDQVSSWWAGRPYSLLLATGSVVEAIEVGVNLGRRTASALRTLGSPVPIVATPAGRWYFLTAGGQGLCSALTDHPDVTLHSAGSWVPIPPTTFQHGVVHWRVNPDVCGWQLADPELVQDALCVGADSPEDVATLVAANR